jgi:hypothetical protein
MKKLNLRSLIKEELAKALNEVAAKFQEGDTFIYMGQKHTVLSDDGYSIRAELPGGKIKKYNYNQIKNALNESPYPLIGKKMDIADMVTDANIEDTAFGDQSRSNVINFIKNGNPSETYLEGIVKVLKDNGVDVSKLSVAPVKKKETEWNPNADTDVKASYLANLRASGTSSGLD